MWSVNKSARAADHTAVSAAEAGQLFGPLSRYPVIALAVSGGPDSTALLMLAARWRNALGRKPKLVAVTVDHGLRPAAKAEARAVARLAEELGVEHRILRWTGAKPSAGLQAAAREARYLLLAKAARKAGAALILTGHTLDDQAETVLMRLARGSGVAGLAGMTFSAPVPGAAEAGLAVVRPFLGIPKARLVATLKAAKVPFAEDPTNRDPFFTRVRLRESAAALAREGMTPERLALLARRVLRSEAAHYEVLNAALRTLAPPPWPPAGPIILDSTAFSALPDEIRLRALGRMINWTGSEGPVELRKLEALSDALAQVMSAGERPSPRFRRTLAGAVVTASRGRLIVEQAPPRRARTEKRPDSALTSRKTQSRKLKPRR